ncbi:nucleoside triphosphatase YtkD [Bacillus sp. AFS073361]|uniref:RNA deprotection pyrophosphohydrolase n=1 Tax=Bacillus sp. AFS073361 TaxID=2033511 RepID=UPI000BF59256|nr:nucleoside triphosphatase YtkD [Bacillus sp. AFS073361]PFP27890.1 nucleoside triphosphatase YtkD [Bacillus sp. AFS073361]
MIHFLDANGNKGELSFSPNSFQEKAKHVLVICQHGDEWLLTNHKQRGLEFPGGKMESGETLEEAAQREVFEETGAILTELIFLAEYKIFDPEKSFVKTVFWGNVKRIEKTSGYYETDGPVLVQGDILTQRFGDTYSFIMKDQVIEQCVKHIQRIKEQKE